MQIEKNIAFLVNQQFPAIYRENGPELVALVEEYYNFMETTTNQSNYVNRRLFEYKDISTTISSMIIFFQKKYMADLPFKEDSVKFILKNIMDLYRRKGTSAGIKLFFNAFYGENISIFYPASKMFKPSDSKWKTGIYLQMFQNSNYFTSISGKEYTYNDLLGRNIEGSASGAKSVVDKINFVILNGISVPIIYIEGVQGTFKKYDNIFTNIGGEIVYFGKVNGSLSNFLVDESFTGTTGNNIGDMFNISSKYGFGGKAIVTAVSEEFTGQVNYNMIDGGFGYSIENTRLIVSDQTIVLNNANLIFKVGERLVDTANNSGVVIGQNESAVGVKLNENDEFDFSRPISTADRQVNITLTLNSGSIAPKNNTSPGLQYADDNNEPGRVKVDTLSNQHTVSVILDKINPFLSIPIDGIYNTDTAMSGTTDPITLSTTISDAFDLTDITIGTVNAFTNINPGSNYVNDVFGIVVDDLISSYGLHDQIILLADKAATGNFTIGEIITEETSGKKGIVRETNMGRGYIVITPYSYYGFGGSEDIIRGNNDIVGVARVDNYYQSKVFGNNASINTRTEFAVGTITEVAINDSGFGYVDGLESFLLDSNGNIQCKGTIGSLTQGKTSGYWSSLTSHINGYRETPSGDVYYDSGMKIQDSNYYQEYSYEIKSMMGIERYETLLRENAHLAGTKVFGKFSYKNVVGGKNRQRFERLFNDQGKGSALENL